ncbi:hypothetical protein GCM10027035_22760 [Emticicia sediminis]
MYYILRMNGLSKHSDIGGFEACLVIDIYLFDITIQSFKTIKPKGIGGTKVQKAFFQMHVHMYIRCYTCFSIELNTGLAEFFK